MQIAICDDNKIERALLKTYCLRYLKESYVWEIAEYDSGESFLRDNKAQILLLDIEMDGMSGIAVKEKMRERRSETQILFITSHGENMPDAFGKNVSGFLEKPVTYDEFKKQMDRVMQDIAQLQKKICVQVVNGFRNIEIKNILYMEAKQKYVDVKTVDGTIAVMDRKGIGQWGQELEKYDFLSPHRSFLVNLSQVKKVDEMFVHMNNGDKIKLSRDKKQEVRRKFYHYLEKNAW